MAFLGKAVGVFQGILPDISNEDPCTCNPFIIPGSLWLATLKAL